MKKLLLIFVIFLTACSYQQDNLVLHVFVNKTCSECQLLKDKFIPLVHKVEIIYHDMDEKESVQLYQDYLDTLQNIDTSLYNTPLTPFIFMEDGFGAIGYNEIMNDIYLCLIEETIQHKDYSNVPSGVWICKED